MYYRIVIILFASLSVMGGLHAQSYKFRSYGQAQGIEQRFIYTINQAQNGYLLIGTEDGLLKFNGVNFKNTDILANVENPGIITVSTHFEEAKIWYGFNDGRIILLNLRDYTVVFDSVIAQGSISGIVADQERNVWISTISEGLFRIDGKLDVFSYDLKEYNDELQINCLNLLPPGELILGTGGGLISVYLGDMKQASSIPKGSITANLEYNFNLLVRPRDSIGLYVGTKEHGLWFYSGKKKGNNLTQMNWLNDGAERNIKAVVEDKDDQLWVAVAGEGLYKLSRPTKRDPLTYTLYSKSNGLKSNSIRSLYCDGEGSIWIGHYGQGLSSFLDNFLEFYPVIYNEQANRVNSLIEVDGDLILGTPDGVLRVRNQDWNSIEAVFPDQTGGKSITCLVRGQDGSIWIGTESDGLYRWNIKSNVLAKSTLSEEGPLSYINFILPVENGLWIATRGGLRYVNYDYSGLVTYTMNDGLPSNNISSLFRDDDDLWIASNISVVARFADGNFEQHILNTGETVVNIVGISAAKNGDIWVATEGKGLIKVDDEEPEHIEKSNGLGSNYCQGILKDKYGNFLVLHRGGISRVWRGMTGIDVMDEDNGIDAEFNHNGMYADANGDIWLGTTQGVIKYIPDNNAIENQGPAVHLVSVQLRDRKIDFSKNVELSYGPHRLEIQYEGISFKNGKNIRYQYILEGFDEEWSEWTTQDRVVYRKLQEGKYRFRVRGCISEDACTTTRSLVNIEVDAPFWKTWWFYISVVAGSGIILYLIIKGRERNFRETEKYLQGELNDRIKEVIRHEHELEEKNELLEESVRQKETLLKEVHHRVKNNLQLVSSLLSLQARNVDDERVADILQNSQSRIGTMALLHKKLYTSEDISSVPYQEYVENLASSVSEVYESEACEVTMEINLEDVRFGIDTSVPLGLILNELITNCYKYAFEGRSTGLVKIDLVHLDGVRHRLTVADDGVGMPKGFDLSQANSLGLELVTVLSEQLGGNVKCVSTQKGTNFAIAFNVVE